MSNVDNRWIYWHIRLDNDFQGLKKGRRNSINKEWWQKDVWHNSCCCTWLLLWALDMYSDIISWKYNYGWWYSLIKPQACFRLCADSDLEMHDTSTCFRMPYHCLANIRFNIWLNKWLVVSVSRKKWFPSYYASLLSEYTLYADV